MQSTDYDARVNSQIAQDANPDRLIKPRPIPPRLDTQAHPASDHRGIRVADAVGFYAGYAAEALRQPGASRRIISFGAGDCVHEIALIKRLLEMGKGLRHRRDGIVTRLGVTAEPAKPSSKSTRWAADIFSSVCTSGWRNF